MPIDKYLSHNTTMHEGEVSTLLGLSGAPSIAEEIILKRDIDLLEYSASRLHITGISTAKSVALIKNAKKKGLNITCSTTPYHLIYTHHALQDYDSNFKLHCPLRTEADRKALIAGIIDGTIDCISTHHTPQDWDAKNIELEYAQPGMIGLETCLHTLLQTENEKINPEKIVEILSTNTRKIFDLPILTIEEGELANLTLFNTSEGKVFDNTTKQSMGINSIYLNQQLRGNILAVFNNGHVSIN
jgi:dihydroorotase